VGLYDRGYMRDGGDTDDADARVARYERGRRSGSRLPLWQRVVLILLLLSLVGGAVVAVI